MLDRNELLDPEQMAQRAVHFFSEKKLTCSESCLAAGAEALGIESPLLPEIAVGLGGGVGMQGDVCGAVTGCAMVLSLAAAKKAENYPEKKKMAMGAAGRLYRQFAAQSGSVKCIDICGVDLTTAEGPARLMAGPWEEKCIPAVAKAARLLAEELKQMTAS